MLGRPTEVYLGILFSPSPHGGSENGRMRDFSLKSNVTMSKRLNGFDTKLARLMALLQRL